MTPKILKLWHNTKAILKIDDKPTKGSNNLVTSGGVYSNTDEIMNIIAAVHELRKGYYNSTADEFYPYRDIKPGQIVPPPVPMEKEEGVLYIDITDNNRIYTVVDGHYVESTSGTPVVPSGGETPIYLRMEDIDEEASTEETTVWPSGYAPAPKLDTPVYLVFTEQSNQITTKAFLRAFMKHEETYYALYEAYDPSADLLSNPTNITVAYINEIWGYSESTN